MTSSAHPVGDTATSTPSERGWLAAAGGLSGAFAATACCILPLILFTAGVGGVWVGRLAGLAPYQPYFIAFALASIGFGFWQVYGAPARRCADGEACARPLPQRAVKSALWLATGLVGAAAIYPYVLPFIL